ncbi:MAG: hypothetical protein ABW321_09160, partial [Polyangiales bacterium]
MEEFRAIAVSPHHQIRLAREYLPMIDRAPATDFVVHVIEQRQANNAPLMSAEIVIAGAQTRERYPLAKTYPLHFRKTYFAARLHGDPRVEHEHAQRASELAQLPPPIGATYDQIRTCFIPGRPYRLHSPFEANEEVANLRRVRDVPVATAAGLWHLLEAAYHLLRTLHAGGLSHGDAQLQNFIVSTAPLEVVLVDFEAAKTREQVDDEASWNSRCATDLMPVLQEALLLQASLGRQAGQMADHALAQAPTLFKDAARVTRY